MCPAKHASLNVPVAALAPRIRPRCGINSATSSSGRRYSKLFTPAEYHFIRARVYEMRAAHRRRHPSFRSNDDSYATPPFVPVATRPRVSFRHRRVQQNYPHPPLLSPLLMSFSFSVTFFSSASTISSSLGSRPPAVVSAIVSSSHSTRK